MDEHSPVSSDEIVYRRVPAQPTYIDLSLPILLTPLAFYPHQNDTDGLSVYRALFVQPGEIAERHSKPCFVVRLQVAWLLDLELTLIPDPRPPLPGHTLIPELRRDEYEQDKQSAKELQLEIVRRVGPSDVVYSPPGH